MPWDKPYGEEIVEQITPKVETQEEMIVRLIKNHEQDIERISVGKGTTTKTMISINNALNSI